MMRFKVGDIVHFHSLKNGNQDVSELEKLKRIMLAKRKEARKYATESLNDKEIKTIKLEVGRSISRKTLEVQAL